MSITPLKKDSSSLIGSVGVVSAATAISRILGLVREQVMAYYFGAGMATDAFLTAFRIPNLLRDMFAEGALSSAFVPVFKEVMVKEGEQTAFRLAHAIITAILLVVGAIVLLGIIAAPAIVFLSANGFTADPVKFDLTVDMTRLMMVYLLLVSLSALVMGMLNSFGRFGLPAISPALFNLGIIVAVIVMYRWFDQPAYTLAIGVVLGGAAQLAIQLPALWKIGYRFRPLGAFLDDRFKQVIRLLMPMILGLSAGRVNILVSTLLASFMAEGSISFLSYSYRLMHFPLGVFAVALGTVALPRVSEIVAREDWPAYTKEFDRAMGLNLLVVIPSACFLAFLGPDIVRLVYQWGAFSEIDSAATALALLHYSYGLIGFAVVRVIVPFFYAQGDSRTPMRMSIISVVLNMLLYYPFVLMLDFAGLAAATSLAGLVNAGLLLYALGRGNRTLDMRNLALNCFRILVAAMLAMYIALLIPWRFFSEQGELISRMENLVIPTIAAGVLYLFFCVILRVREIGLLRDRLLGRRRTRA